MSSLVDSSDCRKKCSRFSLPSESRTILRASLGFQIAGFLRKLLLILSNMLFVIKPRFKFRALN